MVDYRLHPETPLNYRELTGRFPSPSWSPFFLLLVFSYTCILLPGMALGVGLLPMLFPTLFPVSSKRLLVQWQWRWNSLRKTR